MYIAAAAVISAFLPFTAGPQTIDGSVEALLERYRSDPANSLLCEQIGVAYTRLSDFDKAAGFFRKAVDLNPERTPAQKNLATVLWFLGRKDESATIFGSLEKRIPNDPVPHLYLGLSAYDHKNMQAAAAHFEEAGALASENPETFPIVIESYNSTGRSARAIALLERRIGAGNSDAQTYRWLGDAYDAQAQPDRAFRAYSEAITRQPEVEENYLALAAFSIEHANPSFARDVLSRGLQRTPNSAKLLLELGLAWALQGDFNKAKQYFADANSADPAWSVPLLALGVTGLQTGDPKGAADCFSKARNVAPTDYRCYYLHAVALNRSDMSHDAATRSIAISELRRAIALDPGQAKARVALADTEIADGQLSAAEAELHAAIRIDPTESTALYKLALLCRRNGKAREADRLLSAFQQSKNKSKSEENEFVLILKVLK